MNVPLVLDKEEPKWILLEEILKIFDSRRVKQEMSKLNIKPVDRAGVMLRIVMIAMFFSKDISYVIKELEKKEDLRIFAGVVEVPSTNQVYSFLGRFSGEQFVELVLRLLNALCTRRSKNKSMIIVDSTDISLDINWLKKKISKRDLEDREFKWGYSPSKKYYIGYKLTLAIEYPSLKPLAFLLHEGSPHDSKIYDEILLELRRRRIARNGDILVFDKGYFSYKNYVKGISRFKIVPLIYPKVNFNLNKALSMISYPLTLWSSKKPDESQKAFYQSLARKLKAKLENWRKYKPLRSTIDDLFKLAKKSFPLEKIHRYTMKSVKKFVSLGVLLVGIVLALGFNKKESIQRLAEW